ncbi:Gfo/Idh/MocA family oxidoreductase [Nocardia sp. IBHARD005]|uniref:Gfo/Idh/MocA family oxidoreductase n=1 Tax=Nocardia sp. IBHARD005 TaxID=3457765 RepID=UPI004058B973
MHQLGVAVVGYGLAGSVFHAPLIAADPRMRVAAVVTSSPERAAQARAEHPGVRVWGSAQELFVEDEDECCCPRRRNPAHPRMRPPRGRARRILSPAPRPSANEQVSRSVAPPDPDGVRQHRRACPCRAPVHRRR